MPHSLFKRNISTFIRWFVIRHTFDFIYFSDLVRNFDLLYVAQRHIKLKSLGSLTKAKVYIYRHFRIVFESILHFTHTFVICIKHEELKSGMRKRCSSSDEYISALCILIGWWVERSLIVVSPRDPRSFGNWIGQRSKKESERCREKKRNAETTQSIHEFSFSLFFIFIYSWINNS